MKLAITPATRTRSIQDAFNSQFPFLKIEFFKKKHVAGEATLEKDMVRHTHLLFELNDAMKEGSIVIDPSETVGSFEQRFQERFGIAIQVFRKQGSTWLETTHTDDMTFSEQNQKGKEASLPVRNALPGDRYLEDGQY
jgi:hypothetical protein